MTILDGFEQLEHLFLDVVLLDESLIHYVLEDFSSFAEFHDKVLLILVMEVVLEFNDVGVI